MKTLSADFVIWGSKVVRVGLEKKEVEKNIGRIFVE